MIIYSQEQQDGLSSIITERNSISYASILEPYKIDKKHSNIPIKSLGSINDSDLYYVQSILVSSSWNRNDDIFDKSEVWAARHTPEDKPTNLEHDENLIIGHITSNWSISDDGQILDDQLNIEDLPEKFHIVTGSVIYKAFSSTELKDRAEKLIAEIENGSKYVSMECYFKGFDYGLVDKVNGSYKILARNDSTAFLTKYLRAYGGQGEHENYKIGRVLRQITFSGKGFVDKPANPDSIIFNKQIISDLVDKKNNVFNKSGVIDYKPTTYADTENIMNDNIDKQVAEINNKLDIVSAGCADQVAEAKATASKLQETNQKLEAAMNEKEHALTVATEELEQVRSESEKLLAEKTLELETIINQYNTEKAAISEELNQLKTDLSAANELIAGYKMKEEEMARKDKMMKRKASLVEAGLEDDAASAAVEKFEAFDDESFDAMTSLLAAMKPKKVEEDEPAKDEMPEDKKDTKRKASEEIEQAESALEEVEVEESVALSIGNDESQSAEANIRSELVEFVSARLGNHSK